MAIKRLTRTDEKHNKIIEEYERAVREAGEYAKKIRKIDLYEIVAERVMCSAEHVSKVVCMRLNKKS